MPRLLDSIFNSSIRNKGILMEIAFSDGYRRISINNRDYRVNKTDPRDKLDLRIYPINNIYSEVRFWRGEEHIDTQQIKNTEFKEFGLNCG